MDTKDEALQAELIMSGGPSAGAAVLSADPPVKTERAPRRRTDAPSRIERQIDALMGLVALLGAIGIAGVIWWWGAGFTVDFLAMQSAGLKAAGWPVWIVPVVVTGIELKYWRALSNPFSPAGALVGAVLIFDIGSSFAGFIEWTAGRTLPLFTGISFPESGVKLWVLGVSAGVIFAFAPERIVRWALAELVALRKK